MQIHWNAYYYLITSSFQFGWKVQWCYFEWYLCYFRQPNNFGGHILFHFLPWWKFYQNQSSRKQKWLRDNLQRLYWQVLKLLNLQKCLIGSAQEQILNQMYKSFACSFRILFNFDCPLDCPKLFQPIYRHWSLSEYKFVSDAPHGVALAGYAQQP